MCAITHRAGEVMTAQGPLHGGGDLYQLSLVAGEHFVMTLLLKSGESTAYLDMVHHVCALRSDTQPL